MKRLQIIAALFIGIFLFFGCQPEWKEPIFKGEDWVPPKGTASQQFWTINSPKVLGKHTNGTPPDSLESVNSKYLRYIRAVVVSSDEGGNYFKSMVIQDATGGVELELDMPGLYNAYPVGQKIVLVCNGLVIGDYNNLPQIGWIYNGTQVGRINALFIDKYIIKDGLPSLKNLPKILTNNDIDFSGHNDINKLVRLEGVTFQEEAIGKPFAFNDLPGPTNWKINVPLANGTMKEVMVRTSNYAKFRSMIIENKEYSLTGILTIYRSTYQLMIRTKEDIKASSEESLVFDFTSNNPLVNGQWSNYPATSSSPWAFRTNYMAHIGNPSGDNHKDMDDWFISPEITYPDMANGYLRIEHQLPVNSGVYDAYQIYYTTSKATTFNLSDWKVLGTLNSFPELFDWSNRLPISKIDANTFRIAFRYLSKEPEVKTSEWRIRKVEIRNK